MTLNLTEEKLAELKSMFELFDVERKGKINFVDLNRIFLGLGHQFTDREFKEMIGNVDKDQSNEIEFQEFLDLIVNKMKDSDTDEELIEAFKSFDKSGNGFVTIIEFKNYLNSLGENLSYKEIEDILNDSGVKYDGKITYDDFVKFMNN